MKRMRQKTFPWMACVFVAFMSLVGCDNYSSHSDHTGKKTVIEVTPSGQILSAGEQFQYKAYLVEGKNKKQLTEGVLWETTDANMAGIDAKGDVTAKSAGKLSVVAHYHDITGSALLTVKSAALRKIMISPDSANMHIGERKQFSAQGVYDDKTVENITHLVSWSSDSPEDVSINETTGMAQAKQAGSGSNINLTATKSLRIANKKTHVTGSTKVTVSPATLESLSIQPGKITIHPKQEQQFTALSLYSDGYTADITDQTSWSTEQANTIQIYGGLVIGKDNGVAILVGSFNNKDGIATVDVTSGNLKNILITPNNTTLNKGEQAQYYATGVYSDGTDSSLTTGIEWVSEKPQIISMDLGTGVAHAMAAGSTSIRAVDTNTQVSASVNVAVSEAALDTLLIIPSTIELPIGVTKQLIAEGVYTDGKQKRLTNDAEWAIDNDTIVQFQTTKGLLKANSVGSATITVSAEGKTATAQVQVTQKQLASLKVAPASAAIPVGVSMSYTATATYTDKTFETVTEDATWSIAPAGFAPVGENTGKLTATGKGSAQVIATFGGTPATSTLKVHDAELKKITISPSNKEYSFVAGIALQLSALGLYSDDDEVDITQQVIWVSESPDILTVIPSGDKAGLATPENKGRATVKAIDREGGVTARVEYDVAEATLDNISLSPLNPNVPQGSLINLTAMGSFSDGESKSISEDAVWTSSDEKIATVTQDGKASALRIGPADITVSLQGENAKTTLAVVDGKGVKEINITPNPITLAPLQHEFLHAEATFNDGTKLDVTTSGDWKSSNWIVATIPNIGAWKGRAYASGAPGTCTITHTYKGIKGTATLTVK